MTNTRNVPESKTKSTGTVGRPRKTQLTVPAHQSSLSAEDRHHYISVAAYHKAEARGFGYGDPVQDWLTSERAMFA